MSIVRIFSWCMIVGIAHFQIPFLQAQESKESRETEPLLEASAPLSSEPVNEALTLDRLGWYFRGEAMVLQRIRIDNRSYVNRWSDNARVLTTEAWDESFEPTGRLTLGYRASENWSIDGIGWWVNSFDDYASYSASSGTIRQPFYNHNVYSPRPVIGEQPALVELAYQSRIQSVEVDFRRWLTSEQAPLVLGIFSGPRFFRLEEEFQDFDSRSTIRGADPTDTVYQTYIDNNMWGGQVGLTVGVNAGPRFGLRLDTLGALTWNNTIGINQLSTQDGSITYFRSASPDERVNGLSEFRLLVQWRLTTSISLIGGYNATYFWSMTSAPDVLSFNLTQQSKLNNELAFWVHGPTAGLEISF